MLIRHRQRERDEDVATTGEGLPVGRTFAHLAGQFSAVDPVGSGPSVVVGVAPAGRNASAVTWATEQAAAMGRPLDTVTVPDDDPTHALLARSDRQTLLVVGAHERGTLACLSDSCSVAVAARSRVPVVIVPDGWHPDPLEPHAVVVGVDPEASPDAVLAFAFDEADRHGVPLVVAHGLEMPPRPSPGASAAARAAYDDRPVRCAAALADAVARHRPAHPEVDVRLDLRPGHPANVLVEDASRARVLVIGRSAGRHAGLGSVARRVIHRAEVPVAVVPPA